MFKKSNSIISFIFSFGSLAVVLDYLLWPRTIKATETLEQGLAIKIVAGLIFLLLSLYIRSQEKKKGTKNGWLKTSGIINIIVISIFIISFLFYIYIEMTK